MSPGLGFAQTLGVVKAAWLSLAPRHVGSDLGLSLSFPWKKSLVFPGQLYFDFTCVSMDSPWDRIKIII